MTRRFGGRPGSVRLTQPEFDADQSVSVLAGINGSVGKETARQDDTAFVRIAELVVTFAICLVNHKKDDYHFVAFK